MQPQRVNPYLFFGLYGLVVSAVCAAVGLFFFGLTLLYAGFIGVNLGGFFLVGLDKWLARAADLRAPERVIIGLALAGGSVGVFIALHVFRHKTRKPWIQASIILILFLQVVVAASLREGFSPN